MKILLDYLFPITAIQPTPAASTAFLKQVCVVAKPLGGVTVGQPVLCTTISAVQALIGTGASAEVQQLFAAGLSRVYILPMNNLDLTSALLANGSSFFTILISSDFVDADVTEAQASGSVTVTSYANLLTTAADVVSVADVAFTAQASASIPGDTTFQAATSNNATATSLAAQINANPTSSALVTATAVGAVVTITAKLNGASGNNIAVTYTDNGGGNIGATLAGLTAGKLAGGTGLEVGAFTGVTGISSTNDTFLALQAAKANRCAFHVASANGAKNLFFAFGNLLANSLNWLNQQYILMPLSSDVTTLGAAENLFSSRISFVISDDEFSSRLGFFVAGGNAIVSPYIKRNLQIDLQSRALNYIASNEPGYTKTQAALLEDELQKVVDSYVDRSWIEAGVVQVSLVQDNFVASGEINIAEPKALWRIFGEMRATL